MNFTVYSDNHLIYNRQIVSENGTLPYIMIDPTLTLSNERFSTFVYKTTHGDPAYEFIGHLNSRVKIYRDGDLYWTGRVFGISPEINRIIQITCEDFLGVFNDSICRPFSFEGTAADCLTQLVSQHNGQVNADQQFYAVNCDIDDQVNVSSTLYKKTWQIVKSNLLDAVGGYMWIEYDAQERPILYYSKSSRSQKHSKATQKIRFAKNIINYKVDIDANSFYTACLPLGATVDPPEESVSKKKVRVTIASVNDGNDYLVNTEAAALYGIIYAPVSETTFDDALTPEELLIRGQEYLANRTARFVRSISISAADLNGIDGFEPSIEWLDSVKCEAPDFDDIMVVRTVTRKLDNPFNVKINLGDSGASLTGKSASNSSNTTERITNIESDYTTSGEAREVAEETIENSSMIQQLPDQILTEVRETYTSKSEFEEFTETTSTRFAQLPNEFQLLFTQVLEGAGLTEISAYLRVLNGNLHLGRSTSEIKACLKNDILIFYTGSDELASVETSLAYFSSGKLFVKTAQVRSITISDAGADFDFRILGEGDNECLFISGREA